MSQNTFQPLLAAHINDTRQLCYDEQGRIFLVFQSESGNKIANHLADDKKELLKVIDGLTQFYSILHKKNTLN